MLSTSAQYASFVPDSSKSVNTAQDASISLQATHGLKSAHAHLLNEPQSGNEGFGTSSGSENEQRRSHEHRSRRKRDRKLQETELRLASIAEQQTVRKHDENQGRHERQPSGDDQGVRGPHNLIPVSTREKSRTGSTIPSGNNIIPTPANGHAQTPKLTPPQNRHDGWGLPDQTTVATMSQKREYIPPIRPIPDSPAPFAPHSVPGRGELGDPTTSRPPSRSHLQPPQQVIAANHSPQQSLYAKWTPPTPSKISPTLKSSDHSRSTSHGNASNPSPPKRGLTANESPSSGHGRRPGEHSPSKYGQQKPSNSQSLLPTSDQALGGYPAPPTHPSNNTVYDHQVAREKSSGKVSELVAGIEARLPPTSVSNTRKASPPQSDRPFPSSQPNKTRDRKVSLLGDGALSRLHGDSSPSFNVAVTANDRGRVVSFSASNNGPPNAYVEHTPHPLPQSPANFLATHMASGGKVTHAVDDRLSTSPNIASHPGLNGQANQQVGDLAVKSDAMKLDAKVPPYSSGRPSEPTNRVTGGMDRAGNHSAERQQTSNDVFKLPSGYERSESGPSLLFQPSPLPLNTSTSNHKVMPPPRPSSTMPFSHPKLAELLSDNSTTTRQAPAQVYSEVPAQGPTTVRSQSTFPEPPIAPTQRPNTTHLKQASVNLAAPYSRNASASTDITVARISPRAAPKQTPVSDLAPNTPLNISQPFDASAVRTTQGGTFNPENGIASHQSRNISSASAQVNSNYVVQQLPSSEPPTTVHPPTINRPLEDHARIPISLSNNQVSTNGIGGKNNSQQGYSSASAQAMRASHSTLQKPISNELPTPSSRPLDFPHKPTYIQSQNHNGYSGETQSSMQFAPGSHASPYHHANISNSLSMNISESVIASQRNAQSYELPESSSAQNNTSAHTFDVQSHSLSASKNKPSHYSRDLQPLYDSSSLGPSTHLSTLANGLTNQSMPTEKGSSQYLPVERDLPRSSSQETLLKTPSSLAVSLKPTVSRTSIPASVQSQPESRKKGFLSRLIPKAPQAEDPYQVWHPVSESALDATGKHSGAGEVETERRTLSSRAKAPPPINIPIPISSNSGRKSPNAKPFTPFRYLSTKRNRTISVASLEAVNGTAPNTVGSPTASMHSSQPPFHPPARRDPYTATQEWRDRDFSSLRGGEKVKIHRPGVVFDVAHEPSEDKQNLKYSKSKSKSRSKR